ncbi:MAG: amidohydrolase [Prolixibacteraceae bacterium]|nr:amidohydrolase [Prolixibacteraceae bacterium]
MSILIKNIELNNIITDIYIEENIILKIGENLNFKADKIIDGKNKAVIPGLLNGHGHAAMSLMRGYADDMPLMPWLEQKIWPLENKLTEEDVYWGTKLACLEMIKNGITTFVDMYHHFPGVARATDDMGLRGCLSIAALDFNNIELAEKFKQKAIEYYESMSKYSDRVKFIFGPHAIYTVSEATWKWISEYANQNNIHIHTHLSETISEVEQAKNLYGCSPVKYLDKLGVLGKNVSLAHCVHLSDEDLDIIAERGCIIVHNPVSNLKLASGNGFRYKDMKERGIPVVIGTDGPSSGNNLDILEAMKIASLNGKSYYNDPTIWNTEETFDCVCKHNERITGWKIGKIEEGYLADISLVNLALPEMTPNFHLISNLVYSANGSCIDTVICDGKILMENRKVPGEEEILAKSGEVARNLINNHK